MFRLPVALVDPQTLSGANIVTLAEYFQEEEGSVFRFAKREQVVQPAHTSPPPLTALTSGGEAIPAPVPIPPPASAQPEHFQL